MIEVLGILAAGIGASYGWWTLQRRRGSRLGLRMLESAFDGDANVVFGVASHAMTSRGHEAMVPLHVLYGLMQDATFTGAIEKLGGAPDAVEAQLLEKLDEPIADIESGAQRVGVALSYVYAVAEATERKISIVDLWAQLARDEVAELVVVDPHALLFLLVHGMSAPEPDLPDRTDVFVILRNDDHTTQVFVSSLLREVFELSGEAAEARMLETHTQGKTIVGRYKLANARDKVVAARARARKDGYPLWIALEDC